MSTKNLIEQTKNTIAKLTEIKQELDPNSAQAEQMRWWIDAKRMELDEILDKKKK